MKSSSYLVIWRSAMREDLMMNEWLCYNFGTWNYFHTYINYHSWNYCLDHHRRQNFLEWWMWEKVNLDWRNSSSLLSIAPLWMKPKHPFPTSSCWSRGRLCNSNSVQFIKQYESWYGSPITSFLNDGSSTENIHWFSYSWYGVLSIRRNSFFQESHPSVEDNSPTQETGAYQSEWSLLERNKNPLSEECLETPYDECGVVGNVWNIQNECELIRDMAES